MAQFSVPRSDDFTIGGFGVTFREESNGSRTLKGNGLYHFNSNSGFYSRGGGALFYPVIEIKNSQGILLHTIKKSGQRIPISSATLGMNWNFSISENKPYNFLRYNSLSVKVRFVSGRGSSVSGTGASNYVYTEFDKLLSSNIVNSGLINLVNVQEETRLANIEKARLASIEKSRLVDVEERRLADIESARILNLESDKLLLDEIRFSGYQVDESRLLELLNQDYSELTKEPLKVTTGIAGIVGFGIIGLLLYTKGGLK